MPRMQYPAHTEPVSTQPETVTVDRWLEPLSQPVLPPRALPAAVAAPALIWSTFTPAAAVTIAWLSPLSAPRPALPSPAYLLPPPTGPPNTAPETTTVDRWHAPLAVPSVLRLTVPAALQPSHTEPVSLTAETVSEDRWHQPLSLPPVMARAGLTAASQLFYTAPASIARETTTVDRWYAPLALPVWAKPALAAAQQAAFIAPALPQPAPERIQTYPPLATPPPKPGLAAGSQQAHAEPVSTAPETTTLDRWFAPLSAPVLSATRPQPEALAWSGFTPPAVGTVASWLTPFPSFAPKPPILTALLPAYVAPVSLEPGVIAPPNVADWLASLAQPTQARPAPQLPFPEALQPDPLPALLQPYPPLATPPPPARAAQQQQPHTEPVSTAPETVTADRWLQPLSLPVLRTARQQPDALAWSGFTPAVATIGWFVPLSVSTPAKPQAQQQAHTEPVSVSPETTSLDRWNAPLSLPVLRQTRPQPEALIWNGLTPPAAGTVASWLTPFPSFAPKPPIRAALLPAYVAPVSLEPGIIPAPPNVANWLDAFPSSAPKPGMARQLLGAYVQPISLAPETTTLDRWFTPLSLPSVLRPVMPAALQRAPFERLSTAKETVTADRWVPPLALPVPPKRSLGASAQLSHTEPVSLLQETVGEDRWHQPLSQPTRARSGHAAIAPALFWSDFTPPTVAAPSFDWFAPLGQTTRRRPDDRTGFATQPPATVGEATTLDRWFAPLATPVRRALRQQPEAFSHRGMATPAAPVVPSVATWLRPLQTPLFRRQLHPALGPAAVAPVGLPPVGPLVVMPPPGSLHIQGHAPDVQIGAITSEGHNFRLSNADVLIEAFGRLGVSPDAIGREHMITGRAALNLELESWGNYGLNLWTFASGTIPLVPGQAIYQLPANLVTMTDLYFRPAGGSDRAIFPMTRTEYAGITNKMQPGAPSKYWYQMLYVPQVTLWEVPSLPDSMTWFGYTQVEDANLPTGETPNIHYRAFDALCSKLALRLCEKFGPKEPAARDKMMKEKRGFADIAWAKLQRRDQEPGATMMRPKLPGYGRMRTPR